VASGPHGDAYYGDVTVVPNVPDALAADCATPLFSALVGALDPGLPLLDGSRAGCQWQSDADAPAPGIFGPHNLPTMERGDWVANMNDSYWLTNAQHPFTRRYARIIGDYQTPRSLRTRLGILQIERRLDGSDGLGAPDRFDLSNLQEIALSSQIYSGELARQKVLDTLCPRAGRHDTTAACAALEQWDGHANLDSVGLPVWQEFWNGVANSGDDYWQTPFDVNDPVNTPRDLDTSLPAVQNALFNAQQALQAAGIDLGAPLAALQYSGVADTRIPIFGAEGSIGAFTVADTTDDSAQSQLTSDGYPIVFGNSYIQTVTWDGGGVHAEGFLTYAESTDPASPHFSDFTEIYSRKQWYRFPFHADEVRAAAISRMELAGS
jgi:acyl-homoserine-lactone acylase